MNNIIFENDFSKELKIITEKNSDNTLNKIIEKECRYATKKGRYQTNIYFNIEKKCLWKWKMIISNKYSFSSSGGTNFINYFNKTLLFIFRDLYPTLKLSIQFNTIKIKKSRFCNTKIIENKIIKIDDSYVLKEDIFKDAFGDWIYLTFTISWK
jgi:hypothetical protein